MQEVGGRALLRSEALPPSKGLKQNGKQGTGTAKSSLASIIMSCSALLLGPPAGRLIEVALRVDWRAGHRRCPLALLLSGAKT